MVEVFEKRDVIKKVGETNVKIGNYENHVVVEEFAILWNGKDIGKSKRFKEFVKILLQEKLKEE